MPAPIALFVYNRPWHTTQTVNALSQNALASESDLVIFSDGPKTESDVKLVEDVRSFIQTISGFKSVKIISSETNKGLAESIITGVTEVLKSYESIIVMEDDLVTSPQFLSFMNQALTLYSEDERVISIHGYVYPVKQSLPFTFFLRGADCWGWATWRRGWSIFESDGSSLLKKLNELGLIHTFDFDGAYSYSRMLKDQIAGKNNSWAVRWHASAFLANRLTLYPAVSFVNNIGLDNSGTHSGVSVDYEGELNTEELLLRKIPIEESKVAFKVFSRYLRGVDNSITSKIIYKIKNIFN
ncbi:MAG: glycosyltransferase [Cyclobacteriaceae bacterium]|nr:glycosyltransferase [Cyclobacteriaceae bacterium]